MFRSTHLDRFAIGIRDRSVECFVKLPANEAFDWVLIKLTSRCSWPEMVRGFQEFAGTLADDDARGHGISGRHAWQDRSIGDPQ